MVILTVSNISFSPMIEFLKPTDRVGIMGIGGLGHLAIQFAAKVSDLDITLHRYLLTIL